MKTVLDKATREELISRIGALTENSQAQWGKMNVGQMVKHCTLYEEMAIGKKKYKRAFIGRLFGKIALKKVLRDDAPLTRNTPTLPELRIKEAGDILAEKAKWIGLINEYEHLTDDGFVHPFFGKMTKEQIGYMAYKHTDHHLRQFNG
ncbi:MAG: DinB family protein [Bacteroidetes bacterium]|nr:DinB family protein [Bacteroidota bacterium]